MIIVVKAGKWIAKHRFIILLLGILLLIPSFIGMAKTRINYDLLSYLPESLETVEGQDVMVDEYGMGAFAMVVVEDTDMKDIQKLADQSLHSSGEISRIIEEIEITTDEATQVARQAEGIVADQNQSVGSTTDSFREIDSKVTELLKFLQQINAGVSEMEHQRTTTLSAISGISAVSAETAAGSSNVQTAAEKQLQAIQDLDKATSALAARSEELTTILEGFIV